MAASVTSRRMSRSASSFAKRSICRSTILRDLLAIERMEDDRLVDAVQKLGQELLLAAIP